MCVFSGFLCLRPGAILAFPCRKGHVLRSSEAAMNFGTVRTVHFDLLQTTVVPGSPEAPLDSALSGSPWASLMPPPLPEVRVQGMADPTSSYLDTLNNGIV